MFAGGQVLYKCQLEEDQWQEDVVMEDAPFFPDEDDSTRSDDIGNIEGTIQSYTDRVLTYESDIYLAFAGFARFLKLEYGIDLCHGIPEQFFDWFLLWEPLSESIKRRPGAPSWSWSGWRGESWSHIWDWFSRSIREVHKAFPNRTWIVWYQRRAHDSVDCNFLQSHTSRLLPPPTNGLPSDYPDLQSGPAQSRFSFECTQTVPTPRLLYDAPKYYEDMLNPRPGSGFLQFWTVSTTFRLAKPNRPPYDKKHSLAGVRVGIFGRKDKQVGELYINEAWAERNVPGDYELILLCEGRVVRPGMEDEGEDDADENEGESEDEDEDGDGDGDEDEDGDGDEDESEGEGEGEDEGGDQSGSEDEDDSDSTDSERFGPKMLEGEKEEGESSSDEDGLETEEDEDSSGTDEDDNAWKYRVLLIEWDGKGQWATRVATGAIDKDGLNDALDDGPVWKEIILG